jgi:hypothetical protein
MNTATRGASLVFALATLWVPAWQSSAQSDACVASLEPIQGVVQHQSAQDDPTALESWHTVTEARLVSEGDRIRTGGAGWAILTFFEGAQTEIRENTLTVVSTLILPASEDSPFNISMDVLVGTTISNLEAELDAGDRFEVHTTAATAVVRGTRWWTLVTPGGESTFISERGTVRIIPNVRFVAMPAAPAPPGPGEPGPSEHAFSRPELSPGVGMRVDRYGSVLETRPGFRFPAERPVTAALADRNCGNGVCNSGERVTCPMDCLSQLSLPACGNATCEPDQHEDLLVCPSDCGPWPGDHCGDGICDPDESGLTCPQDCAPDRYFAPVDPALCGNSACDPAESGLTCPQDCGG